MRRKTAIQRQMPVREAATGRRQRRAHSHPVRGRLSPENLSVRRLGADTTFQAGA